MSSMDIALCIICGLGLVVCSVAWVIERPKRLRREREREQQQAKEREAARLQALVTISQRVADWISDSCETDGLDLKRATDRTGGAAIGAALAMDSMGLVRHGCNEPYRIVVAITKAVRHKDAPPETMAAVTVEGLMADDPSL